MDKEILEVLRDSLTMLANNGGWGKTELMERIAGLIEKGSSLQQGVMVSVSREPSEEIEAAMANLRQYSNDLLEHCPDAWEAFNELDKLLAAAPSAQNAGPCEICHGTGRYPVGYSGQESDGNAMEFGNCDCEPRAGVAPSAEGENRSAIERAEKHGG